MAEEEARQRWSPEATAFASVGVALVAVLIGYLAPLRADVRDLRAAVANLGERVARIEGALAGPYRLPAPAADDEE